MIELITKLDEQIYKKIVDNDDVWPIKEWSLEAIKQGKPLSERPEGKWICVEDNPDEYHYECSKCGHRLNWIDENDCYCSKCGSYNGGIEAIQSSTPLPKKPEKQIEDLWIYVKWHEITDNERRTEEYPQDWVVYIDSPMPADEEEILVYTKYGAILRDVSYFDDGYSLESGYDWVEDVIAWMPLSLLIPESYREVKM